MVAAAAVAVGTSIAAAAAVVVVAADDTAAAVVAAGRGVVGLVCLAQGSSAEAEGCSLAVAAAVV